MPEIDLQMQCAAALDCWSDNGGAAQRWAFCSGDIGVLTFICLVQGEIPLAIVTSGQVPYQVLSDSRGPERAMTMQVISVVGALMVLIAYGLIQAGTWRELDAGYLALNIIGSLLLGIVALEDRRVGFVLLEFAWAGIAMVGVARAIRARRAARDL